MHNDDVAHEHSDINIRAVITATMVLVVVCLVTAALMYGLFLFLESQAAARDPKLSPLAVPATNMPPTTLESPGFGGAPEPRLLTNEPRNLQDVRQRGQEQLRTSGWIDEKAGVAHIPIDVAKRLLVERGLPVRPDPIQDQRMGTRLPVLGESSSGRVMTQPPPAEPAPAADPATPAPVPAPPHKSVP
jgi:hypothetical protein